MAQFGNLSGITLFDDKGYEVDLQKTFYFNLEFYFRNGRMPFYVINDIFATIYGDESKESYEVKVVNGGLLRLKKEVYERNAAIANMTPEQIGEDSNKLPLLFSKSINKIVATFTCNSQEFHLDLNADDFDFKFSYVKIYGEDEDVTYEYKLREISLKAGRENAFNERVKKFLYGSGNPSEIAINPSSTLGISNFFPYFAMIGSYKQEPVSTDLVAADTFIVMEEKDDESFGILKSDEYSLLLAVSNDSEMQIVNIVDGTDSIEWTSSKLIDLPALIDGSNNAVEFTVGTVADTEGCYQNGLQMYLKNKTTDECFPFGVINIHSEIIGEDERYRTFFANFGVPDPATYPTLFKEADIDQESVDYELVNRKSKELFLTYDKIFPYAGTYKALINAVNFLGYNDIVFKEWIRIYDKDRETRDVAFDSVNLKNGEIVSSALASCGISQDEFFGYKKLNKLSMIYHLNTEKEDVDERDVSIGKYDASTGNVTYEKSTKKIDIPYTIKCFDYSNDALLAKLFYLKRWLEKHIIGVNVRIADITGEGIVFYRTNATGYATYGRTIDAIAEKTLTPTIALHEDSSSHIMRDSSAYIECTLSEFNSTRIEDLESVKINHFLKALVNICNVSSGNYADAVESSREVLERYEPEIEAIDRVIPVSKPVSAPLLIDEVQYILSTDSSCGSLREWSDASSKDQPMLVKDNEIVFVGDRVNDALIDSKSLPIIKIRKGSIRKSFKDWGNEDGKNLLYYVDELLDSTTKQFVRGIKDCSTGKIEKILSNDVLLIPSSESDKNPFFKYTCSNKYRVPLIMFGDYKIKNSIIALDEAEYILDIIDGELMFDKVNVEDSNDTISSIVEFNDSKKLNDQGVFDNEQIIKVDYETRSPRTLIVEYPGLSSSALSGSLISKEKWKKCVSNASANVSLGSVRDLCTRAIVTDSIKKLLSTSQVSKKSTLITLRSKLNYLQKDSSYNESIISAIGTTADSIKKSAFVNEYVDYKYDKAALDASAALREIIMNELQKDESMNVNEIIPVKTNRLGEYQVTALGFDGFNNIYSAKSKRKLEVVAEADKPYMAINSDKAEDYKKNMVFPAREFDMLNEIDDNPVFPDESLVNDIEVDNNSNTTTYKSISYAFDTPKKDNVLKFRNATEVISRIDVNDTSIHLEMLDENNDKVELYHDNAKIKIVFFDNETHKCIAEIGPLDSIESFKQDSKNDSNKGNQSYVNIEYDDGAKRSIENIESEYDSSINDLISKRLTAFALNASEFFIEQDGRLASNEILVKAKDISPFKIGNVIKITFMTSKLYDNEMNDETYIGSTSYRIVDMIYDSILEGFVMSLDGDVNWQIACNGEIYSNIGKRHTETYAKVSLGSTSFMELQCIANKDSVEISKKSFDTKNFAPSSIETEIKFNGKWFPESYLDNTYSLAHTDFDEQVLDMLWVKPQEYLDSSTDLYVYEGPENAYPALEKGRNVIIGFDKSGALHNPDARWRMNAVYADTSLPSFYSDDPEFEYLEQIGLLDEYVKTKVFEACNEKLSFKTLISGVNECQLESMDAYGNRTFSEKLRFLVKDEKDMYSVLCQEDSSFIQVDTKKFKQDILETKFKEETMTRNFSKLDKLVNVIAKKSSIF